MSKVINWFKKEAKETKLLLKNVPALVLSLFVLSVILMNVLANKEINTGLSWLKLDSGLLISWLAFLTMDVTVKHFGPKASIRLSIVAMLINLLVSVFFILVASIPGTWGEAFTDIGVSESVNSALNNTFRGNWFILFGSSLAFLVSAIVNCILNWVIGKTMRKDNFFTYAVRSYGSTVVGQFVDNLIFTLVVSCTLFGWTISQAFLCAITNALVELVFEVIFSPVGYKVSKKWKEENVGSDYINYINDTSKNIPGKICEEDKSEMNKFMKLAIKQAEEGIKQGHGGPFGAVIVKDGKVVGQGHNRVVGTNDPTCHGEVDAIRDACKNLNTFDLSGCDIYTTGEPCPMCLSAILWANIDKIYFSCTIKDNDDIGFRDDIFYKNLKISTEGMKDKLICIDRDAGLKLFAKYKKIRNKTMY